MVTFLLGSVLCGFSHTLGELVAYRLVQGVGGAMMTPVGRLIVVGSTPRERLVSAMAWFTMPALIGPLLGPPVAGFVRGVADWPWIFFINVPVCLLGLCAVGFLVPQLREAHPGRFDGPGVWPDGTRDLSLRRRHGNHRVGRRADLRATCNDWRRRGHGRGLRAPYTQRRPPGARLLSPPPPDLPGQPPRRHVAPPRHRREPRSSCHSCCKWASAGPR